MRGHIVNVVPRFHFVQSGLRLLGNWRPTSKPGDVTQG
jgi:hypothetical protein